MNFQAVSFQQTNKPVCNSNLEGSGSREKVEKG